MFITWSYNFIQVEHEEVEKLKEVQQVLKSNSNVDQVQQLRIKSEEIFKRSQNYDDGEKVHILFLAKFIYRGFKISF